MNPSSTWETCMYLLQLRCVCLEDLEAISLNIINRKSRASVSQSLEEGRILASEPARSGTGWPQARTLPHPGPCWRLPLLGACSPLPPAWKRPVASAPRAGAQRDLSSLLLLPRGVDPWESFCVCLNEAVRFFRSLSPIITRFKFIDKSQKSALWWLF